MKKGLIAVVLVAVLAAGGAGGYTVYQKKVAEKKYEQDMTKTISSLPAITVYEKEDLPSVEEEFKGTESNINIDSITPDISGVHTSEPGEYDVKYTFKDSHGTDRTATVKCTVKPELASHVEGMQDIEIDKGDELPTESGCTFDDYVSSVTLNTDEVDNEEAGTYDISYTVLGADGDMKTVEGYTCTVNEVATPTPTATPKPTVTPKPTATPEAKPEDDTAQPETTEAEGNSQPEQAAADTAVGNVEVQNNVVETGDENNIIAIGVLIVVCLGAAAGVLIYKKKKKN